MNKNRVGLTIRFNREEQRYMDELVQFYKRDAKSIMKLGFALLVQSTSNMKKEAEDAKATTATDISNELQSGTTKTDSPSA